MTVREEREERKNERENYCNENLLLEILKRTGKISREVADTFDGICTEGMELTEKNIIMWVKRIRMARLWIYDSVKEMTDSKLISATSVNSFETGRPVRFDMVVRVLTKMIQDKNCFSRLYEIIPYIFYAIMGNCNVQIVLTQRKTNIPVSNHFTLFSADEYFDEKETGEENEAVTSTDEAAKAAKAAKSAKVAKATKSSKSSKSAKSGKVRKGRKTGL